MSTNRTSKSERDEALARLRGWIKPGDVVFTILRHVSASGMSRVIQLVKVNELAKCPECDRVAPVGELAHSEGCSIPEPVFYPSMAHLGWNVAKACGYSYDRDKEGVKIGGCGMDMGFALVDDLAATLWPYGSDERKAWKAAHPRQQILEHRWL